MVIRLAMPGAFHATLAEMVALEEVTCRVPSVTDTSGVPGADDTGGVGAIVVEGVGAMVWGAWRVVAVDEGVEVLDEGAGSDERVVGSDVGVVVELVDGGVAADAGEATDATPPPMPVTITTPARPTDRRERVA
jgi:hypothetical protein